MRRRDAVIIGLWFAASRLIAASAGVAPDRALPAQLWQLLPFELLEHRLGESLWYLHSQPPLYNAVVGLLLKLPGDVILWWRLLWIGVGLGFPLLMFAAMRWAGAPRVAAHITTLAVSFNPTLLLYENLLLYSYPEALCVLAGFVMLLPITRSGVVARPAWVGFAVATTALVAFRSMFQPLWSVAIAVTTLTAVDAAAKRKAAAAVMLPLLVGAVLAVKTGLMFGAWTSSSWYGHNAAKLMAMAVLGETPALVSRGIVSPVFATGPFQPIRMYPAELVEQATARVRGEHGDIPALLQATKVNGSPNFNHAAYIDLSRQLAADSAAAYQARPWLVHEAIAKGVVQFFQPASLYPLLAVNWPPLQSLETFYREVLYPGGRAVVVQLTFAFALLSSTAVWLFGTGRFFALRAPAGYVAATLLWVAGTSNLVEFGENARFRFTTDPLMVTWITVFVVRLTERGASAGLPPAPSEKLETLNL